MRPVETAAALNVGVATLRRWEEQERITAFRSAGGMRMYPASEVERIRGLTSADFRKITDAETEGFGDNTEPTTLGNVFQKYANGKDISDMNAPSVAGIGFPPHNGAFPSPIKED